MVILRHIDRGTLIILVSLCSAVVVVKKREKRECEGDRILALKLQRAPTFTASFTLHPPMIGSCRSVRRATRSRLAPATNSDNSDET